MDIVTLGASRLILGARVAMPMVNLLRGDLVHEVSALLVYA